MLVAAKPQLWENKNVRIYLNREELFKLVFIPKLDIYFCSYIIEVDDDHGSSVVQDQSVATLSTDVRGEYDQDDDPEGVNAEGALQNERKYK